MRMLTSQRGITLIGFLIVLALAGFFFLIGAKLLPMYTEFYAVKAAMVQVQNTPGAARLSPEKIWNILEKTFFTSDCACSRVSMGGSLVWRHCSARPDLATFFSGPGRLPAAICQNPALK